MIANLTPREEAIWTAVYAGEVVKSRAGGERFDVSACVRAADWAVEDLRRLTEEAAEREAAKTPPATPRAKGRR